MTASSGLSPFLSPLTALVGAGGKTSTMFSLAREAAILGRSVLVTTTTHLADHRLEQNRRYDRCILCPGLAPGLVPGPAQAEGAEDELRSLEALAGPGVTLLASGASSEAGGGRLIGVDPGIFPRLEGLFDLILVEADGSRGLPLKLPGEGEPALPARPGAVLGLMGLDCLGSRVLAGLVHRPERFGALGIGEGAIIGPEVLQRIVASPLGLFKDCPPGCLRVVVLNKSDLVGPGQARDLAILLAALPGIAAVAITGRGPSPASLLEEAVVYSRLPKETPP